MCLLIPRAAVHIQPLGFVGRLSGGLCVAPAHFGDASGSHRPLTLFPTYSLYSEPKITDPVSLSAGTNPRLLPASFPVPWLSGRASGEVSCAVWGLAGLAFRQHLTKDPREWDGDVPLFYSCPRFLSSQGQRSCHDPTHRLTGLGGPGRPARGRIGTSPQGCCLHGRMCVRCSQCALPHPTHKQHSSGRSQVPQSRGGAHRAKGISLSQPQRDPVTGEPCRPGRFREHRVSRDSWGGQAAGSQGTACLHSRSRALDAARASAQG